MPNAKVVIFQYRLLHYRLRLFELLRERLKQDQVELLVVHGQPTDQEAHRNDTGTLAWAIQTRNRYFTIGGRDVLWNPVPPGAADAALSIVMQESRLLTNYLLLLRRAFDSRRLVAFWGHGRNYQSTAPNGLREQWKRWWTSRVDWWFAYTEATRDLVVSHGFPAGHVTVLDNAIDSSAFAADLAACTADDLALIRRQAGLPVGANVAIYCGSLYPGKRLDVMLAAADIVCQRVPDFHLLVVGDGPSADEIEVAATSRPWLHPMGVRKGREKAGCFRLAKVMLNPGLVGLHIVDAFVAGTPLVAQASPRHGPEFAYLRHGTNGWVVEDSSAEAYASAVERLLTDDELLMSLRRGCAAASARYTLENMADNFAQGILACLRQLHALPSPDSTRCDA